VRLAGSVRERAVDASFAAAWRLVRAIPERPALALFQRGGDLGHRRNGRGVRQLRRNLRRVVGPLVPEPELDELVRAGLRSYARYWVEAFRLPAMDKAGVAARLDITGVDHFDKSLADGRGVVVVLPHMGNWDVGAVWLIRHGVRFTTVAERLKPESLFDRFVAYRQGLGMEIVPLTGGADRSFDVLADRLDAGGCVALVGDRDLSARGVEVSFFGEAARMPPGPALLAARTGAALHSVGIFNRGRDWGARISPAISLPEGRLAERVRLGTQLVADALAVEVAAHTVDWHMLQRLWLADLRPEVGGR
jgi:phosphatidylinositol dimannoside acyltransferase